MSDEQATGTSDPTYNAVSVVYHALQGAETIQKYLDDAGTGRAEEVLRAGTARLTG